ncbi:MAG: hypothetical protein A2X22_04185 [Bacteroidetes bacterium GWF2_49_14]|nr:MAG: hypothetical protein A2X22_04185 [Bacteroidetes bacterium GWF2_49_14]HBB90509.1 hypothetical protein [Bacteroidales bacterium]
MEVINQPGTLICNRCGHVNDERAFFCSNCGAPIGSRAGSGSRYQSPPQYDQYERPYSDGLPLISLLVTIFGFFVAGFIGPLIGVILGHVSLSRLRRSGQEQGKGLAVASLVIGYAMLILGLILLIALGVFVGWAVFNHPEGWEWSNM